VVDLRPHGAPGSIALCPERFERDIASVAPVLPLDGPIVVVAADAAHSREVARKLLDLGYRNVRVGRP
jgi:rhodanese-related sulfurtransferase